MKGIIRKLKSVVVVAAAISVCSLPLKAEALVTVEAPQSVPLEEIFITPKGANSYVQGNNVVITEKLKNQIGSIFSTEQNKINLAEDFYSEMYIYLDGIADGVAFVMHNEPSKLTQFSGLVGKGLSIYGQEVNNAGNVTGGQLKNSFAIEFDTYYNGDSYDKHIDGNGDRGHVAYTFPDKPSSYYYYQPPANLITAVRHSGLQYPTFNMGDGQWRLLKVDWKAWDATDTGQLTYQYGNLAPVTVPITKDTFATDSVYWGFTGSTGALMEDAVVAFKSVPGLVNYSEEVELKNTEGQKIQSTTQNSEVTVHYTGEYHGGKQEILDPVFSFELDKNQAYQEGTFLVNGTAVTPTYSNNVLEFPLGNNLSMTNNLIDIEFKVKDINLTTDAKLALTAKATARNIISDVQASYDITYDGEAPVGVGKVTFIDKNDVKAITEATDYRPFLHQYEDNVTPKDQIAITLKPGQDIETAVSSMGPSEFVLTLTDKIGNARDVTIPLFVKDSSVVKSSKYVISGKDVEVAVKDYPKTEVDLLAMIRNQGELNLWEYSDTAITALNSSQLTFSLGQLAKPPKPAVAGIFEVIASYGEGTAKAEKPLNVTVTQSFATVKISFVDENNQPIVDDLSFEALVDERIDLTKNQQLLEKLEAVKALNYAKDLSPVDEKNLLIVPEGVSRKYTFRGMLFIESAPNTVDFGVQRPSVTQTINTDDVKYDMPFIVWDNRQTKKTWRLKASIETPLTSTDGKNSLPYAIRYKKSKDTVPVPLSEESLIILEQKNGAQENQYDVSKDWESKETGLELNVFKNQIASKLGEYSTTVVWELEDVPF
ncbi:lectin-like domain-containing protein [Enterococcus crotali]|uniref:lectin-like domain-containing protein n=1 Tax=Enterococcus crotali TaxID=1453587 RepID=UPI000B230DB1|nr:WxL domain-containing protein [Enterococcus crotali]